MRVEVWSDIVCPWCYLGEARFERVSGGQRPEVFLQALRQAWDDGHPAAAAGAGSFAHLDAALGNGNSELHP